MKIIGREKEQNILSNLFESNKPEFLVVYGRRRVGKTYLIKEFFNNSFSFYTTGIKTKTKRDKLNTFHRSLLEYGNNDKKQPADWFEAFSRLEKLLKSDNIKTFGQNKRKIVFLDELPWMDSPKSNFKEALDLFWNKYGSSDEKLLLIVCGSATSWIVDNILSNRGGFYNRITRKLHLSPFTLKECEELLNDNRISFSRRQIIETYMVFGGVPYYLSLLNSRLSLAQNIDELCFNENGELFYEYNNLFASLFNNHVNHMTIIELLAEYRDGLARKEIEAKTKISGKSLTTTLNELEQCGFIRKYQQYDKLINGGVFQLIDPFTLFAITYIKNRKVSSWINYIDTGSYNNWAGHAFEMVCFNHLNEIKKVLGIEGVITNEYSYRSKKNKDGAQIDLIIDRKDETINLCEMKFCEVPYTIDEQYNKKLLNKKNVFKEETKTKKSIYITMITSSGLIDNSYAKDITNSVNVEEELFI